MEGTHSTLWVFALLLHITTSAVVDPTLASGWKTNASTFEAAYDTLKQCIADQRGSCGHCTFFDGSDLTNACGAAACKGGCYGEHPTPCALYPALNNPACDEDKRCPLNGTVCAQQCHATAPGKPCSLRPVLGVHTNECCSRVGCGCNPNCWDHTGCSETPKDPQCLFTCGGCSPFKRDCWGNPCTCGAPMCYSPA